MAMESRQGTEPAVVVRLVRHDEFYLWRSLMREHHYLGFDRIVGKALHYVATIGSHWVALLGWGAAALKCGVRDEWIGWDRQTQWRRLHLIANNVRFLILPDWRRPNMASHLLALNLKRLSRDWQCCHGHPVLLSETFVDSSRFRSTCYRQPVGAFSARREAFPSATAVIGQTASRSWYWYGF